MLIKPLMHFFTTNFANPKTWGNPWVKGVLMTLYYLAIIIALILMYGKGNFTFHPFVYQAF
jgi:hypothetical protein